MSDLLLQTKLFKPTPRPSLITRPQLIARLNAGLGIGPPGFSARLTLVSAPAGFGKTTLVSSWLAQLASLGPQHLSENTAWLSLDESDNDPVRFLVYFIAALQTTVPGIGQPAVHLLQAPQPPAAETILTLLINDINQNGQLIILVLEDYHLITTPALHQALTFLLEHLPPQLHLLITTRSDPPLPLSRLRARGQMVEIRQADLRFTFDEVGRLFNQVMDLSLSAEEMMALEQRTEGWIAGLQLAALSMKGRDDLSTFITVFSGSNRFILDYLTDEVLRQRPSGTEQFLLQTSILNPLCASLCDAITGRQDGEANLERLDEANLFITPLDDARTWFRYHPLFAEVLQARLQQTQHGRMLELYHRAVIWHANQGMFDEAVRYALAGGDFEEAALLIEDMAGSILRRGSSALLIRWLDALPEEVVRAHPRLCLARGWTYLWGPALSLESVDEWVQLALQAAEVNNLLNSELAGEIAALQAITATVRGETSRSREISEQALEKLAMDSPWRGVVAFSLGASYHFSGNVLAASRLLDEAMQLSQADGALYLQLISASFLAHIAVYQGRLSLAMEMYQQVLEWAGHGIPHKGALMAHGGLAEILYERNQLEDALAHVQIGCTQLEQIGGSWVAFLLYRTLALIRLGQGSWQDAMEALDLAYQRGKRNKVSYVVAQAAAMRIRLLLAQGDLSSAEVWAANSDLNPEDPEINSPGYRYVEYITLARVLDAQGRHTDALSLLERLLNSAESEEQVASAITILALQSLVFQAQGDTVRTFKHLERALTLAEPGCFIRIFIDEGEPMRVLLTEYRTQLPTQPSDTPGDRSRRLLAYINKLLTAFPLPDAKDPSRIDLLLDPLTERELEVLHHIASGASNREIANALVVAVPTVKKHVSNILSKLNANSRTQAVAEARNLGLL